MHVLIQGWIWAGKTWNSQSLSLPKSQNFNVENYYLEMFAWTTDT